MYEKITFYVLYIYLLVLFQFIDGRLDSLNKGKEPDDLFEEEIQNCETITGACQSWRLCESSLVFISPHLLFSIFIFTGRSKSYQQLVGNLKVNA